MGRRDQRQITCALIAALVSLFLCPAIARAADTLVAAGSVWKYLDDGSNQGTAWRASGFNDSGWASGPAQLGYGDGDESTVVSFGSNGNNKYITTYFRHTFSVADASQYTTLKFDVLRDDGAVAYLNGVEVFRNNMPAGTIGYLTLSSSTISDANEALFVSITLPSTSLVTGDNVLAFEIHQSATNSSDISFDLQLSAKQEAVLLETSSTWKYLDDGSNQGTAWRAPGFNDGLWASGPAQLGYGEGDEATVVSYGLNSANKYITTYFRKSFSVADPSQYRALTFNLLRDDGAVVYLNSNEVFRANMPAGGIGYQTLASVAVADSDESTYFSTTVLATGLVSGVNFVAVEIHQNATNSSDLSFDLRVIGSSNAPLTRGPYLQMGSWSNATVRWRTGVEDWAVVRYGTNANAVTNVAVDATLTNEHIVLVTGLQPETKYYYSIGNSNETLVSGTNYFFVTSPLAGAVRPVRVWVIGDSGTADNNARNVRNGYLTFAGSRQTDLFMMLGDNAYSTGTDDQYQSAVFDMYPTILQNTFVWPTIGNHDSAFSYTANSFPYLDIFSLPTNGEIGGVISGTEKYYSFDYANIHFVCLDSMTSSRLSGGAMLTWLTNDLEQTLQEWTIAFWHHPPYTKGSHNSDTEFELVEMRQNALPILEAYGVDLVLCGHSHSYERSYLLDGHYGISTTLTAAMKKNGGDGREDGNGAYSKREGISNGGAVYVVAGSSGQISGGPLNHSAMYLSSNVLASVVLDINSNRLDLTCLRTDGTTMDYFTILRTNTPPVANPDIVSRYAAQGIRVAVTNVLANDTDADGDPISFVSVSSLSASNATVTRSGAWIYYTPPNGFTNTDSFTYSIADSHGGNATGTVSVLVKTLTAQSANLQVTPLGGGSVRVNFDGIPGRTYRIQYTESLSPPNWQTLASVSADGLGRFEYVDTPPEGSPSRFYRSVYP